METEIKGLDKNTALTTAIIAVFLAISSILGHNMHEQVLLDRSIANDQWGHYQSKSIKQGLYEVNKRILEVQMANPQNVAKYTAELKNKLGDFDSKIEKYEKEKEEIKKDAEKWETKSETLHKKANRFDIAEGFYQLSIILSAISALVQNRKLWGFSFGTGLAATGISLFAFFS